MDVAASRGQEAPRFVGQHHVIEVQARVIVAPPCESGVELLEVGLRWVSACEPRRQLGLLVARLGILVPGRVVRAVLGEPLPAIPDIGEAAPPGRRQQQMRLNEHEIRDQSGEIEPCLPGLEGTESGRTELCNRFARDDLVTRGEQIEDVLRLRAKAARQMADRPSRRSR